MRERGEGEERGGEVAEGQAREGMEKAGDEGAKVAAAVKGKEATVRAKVAGVQEGKGREAVEGEGTRATEGGGAKGGAEGVAERAVEGADEAEVRRLQGRAAQMLRTRVNHTIIKRLIDQRPLLQAPRPLQKLEALAPTVNIMCIGRTAGLEAHPPPSCPPPPPSAPSRVSGAPQALRHIRSTAGSRVLRVPPC